MKFKRLAPSEWKKYKDGILFIEQEIFSEDGKEVDTPEVIEFFAKNPKAIFIIAEHDNIIIGDTYGSPIEDELHMAPTPQAGMDPRFISCMRNFPAFGKYNTICVASTAVLLEYRKRGFAIELKKLFISEAKKEGYKFMTGFSNKESLSLNMKFGARVIKTLDNRFNSGETYYQYYIKL